MDSAHTCLRVQTPSLRRQRSGLIERGNSESDSDAAGDVGAADAVCAVVTLMPLPLLTLMNSVFGTVLQLFG